MRARSCFVSYCVFADAVVAAAAWLYPLSNSLCACDYLRLRPPKCLLSYAVFALLLRLCVIRWHQMARGSNLEVELRR